MRKITKTTAPRRLSVNPRVHLLIWLLLTAVVFYVVFNAVYSVFPAERKLSSNELPASAYAPAVTAVQLPSSRELELHVHPHVTIEVFGVERVIPAGVGITAGNNADNDLSGGRASPVHTHEADSVLHVEVLDVAAARSRGVLSLGYFFNRVWGQRFDSQCIFEYCADARHALTMFVDGGESTDFDAHLLLKDEEIKIVFGEK